jgi:hypothetical protein
MRNDEERPYIEAGATVDDSNGDRVGVVRAVYPHYIAVGEHGDHPQAYRVPLRAIATIAPDRIRLSIPKDVLDPMTAEELTAFGLPEHGGEVVVAPAREEAAVEEEEALGLTGQGDK